MLTGGILLGVVVASAFDGLLPRAFSTPTPSTPDSASGVGSASAPAPSAPTPSVDQEPTGTRIRRGTVSFILPAGWFVHGPTFESYGPGAPFLYLSSQPMHDECVTTYRPDGETVTCGSPIDALEAEGVLVEWWVFSIFAAPLPPGEPFEVGGRVGTRGDFDDSLCSEISADGGFTVNVARTELDRDSITICSRSLTKAEAAEIDLFLDSIEWLDEAVNPSITAHPSALQSAADMIGEWQLVSGIVRGDEVPVLDQSPTTMSFSGREMGGDTPCNVYSARVEVNGAQLSVGMILQTMIGCSGVVQDAEVRYLAALHEVSAFGFRMDGDELVLSGSNAVLVFRRLV